MKCIHIGTTTVQDTNARIEGMTAPHSAQEAEMTHETHAYFTVEDTALTIPKRGALAIYCGDAPRKNYDGTTSHSMRAPVLLMPPEMFRNPEETMAKIAAALNASAGEFYDSARRATPAADDLRAELEPFVKAVRYSDQLNANDPNEECRPHDMVLTSDFRRRAALRDAQGGTDEH